MIEFFGYLDCHATKGQKAWHFTAHGQPVDNWKNADSKFYMNKSIPLAPRSARWLTDVGFNLGLSQSAVSRAVQGGGIAEAPGLNPEDAKNAPMLGSPL